MAIDDYLQNTMTGTSPLPNISPPTLTGNTDQDIKTLESKYNPGGIANFQSLMQTVSKKIYDQRQQSELASAQQQVDPSKVSGGTFASILTYLEKNRGQDISKTYASTMDAYREAQSQIREDMLRLQDEKQRQKERIQNLMAQAPGAKIKETDSWAKAVAKMRKWEAKQLDDEKEAKKADKQLKEAEKLEAKEKEYYSDVDKMVQEVNSGVRTRESANAWLVSKWGSGAENVIYTQKEDDWENYLKNLKEKTSISKEESSPLQDLIDKLNKDG